MMQCPHASCRLPTEYCHVDVTGLHAALTAARVADTQQNVIVCDTPVQASLSTSRLVWVLLPRVVRPRGHCLQEASPAKL
jgi:hypothetical protein